MALYTILVQAFNVLMNEFGSDVTIKNIEYVSIDEHDDTTKVYNSSDTTGLLIREDKRMFKEVMGPLEEEKIYCAFKAEDYIENGSLILYNDETSSVDYKVVDVKKPPIQGQYIYILCEVEELNRSDIEYYSESFSDTVSKTHPFTSPWTIDLTGKKTVYTIDANGSIIIQFYNEDELQKERSISNIDRDFTVYYGGKHRIMVATESTEEIDVTINIKSISI